MYGGSFVENKNGFMTWQPESAMSTKVESSPPSEAVPEKSNQKQERGKKKEKAAPAQPAAKAAAKPAASAEPKVAVELMDTTGLKSHREYYEDTYKFESTGKIIAIEGEQFVLDKTIFHPQGGGQPMDYGVITNKNGKITFKITDLKVAGDAIIHIGKYENTDGKTFSKGDNVKCKVDGEFRSQNARIHSAGHLLDVAMNRAGYTDLKPGKGYHFVEGPYVEYIGVVPDKEREPLIASLNKHLTDLIEEARNKGTKTFKKICDFNEANEHLKGIGGCPKYVAANTDVRVLKLVPDDFGCPCGGTHVDSVTELGQVVVQKMKKKKQNTQVTYKVIAPAN